jgi:hypothetical protein
MYFHITSISHVSNISPLLYSHLLKHAAFTIRTSRTSLPFKKNTALLEIVVEVTNIKLFV